MTKQITVEELNEKIEILKNDITGAYKRIEECKTKSYVVGIDPYSKKMYKKAITKKYNEIEKYENEILTLEYQISVGCRKLKSVLSVSKDLTANGFIKAEYHASSMVRGWGHWNGQFSVENSATKIKINYRQEPSGEHYEKFEDYLKEKYGEALSIDSNKNIYLYK